MNVGKATMFFSNDWNFHLLNYCRVHSYLNENVVDADIDPAKNWRRDRALMESNKVVETVLDGWFSSQNRTRLANIGNYQYMKGEIVYIKPDPVHAGHTHYFVQLDLSSSAQLAQADGKTDIDGLIAGGSS